MKCVGCGAPIADKAVSCEYCGKKFAEPVAKQLSDKEEKVGIDYANSNFATLPQSSPNVPEMDNSSNNELAHLEGLSDYYKEAFEKFDRNSPGLQAKFGWAPLLFGPMWYFYKGLWGKGLIYLSIALSTVGTLALLPWLYGTIFGVYDYYLLKKFDKQFW